MRLAGVRALREARGSFSRPDYALWQYRCPFSGPDGNAVDASSRLARVKEMGAEQLRQVIALPGCQKSVVKAAQRRLKKLEAEQAARSCLNCGNNNPDEEICSQKCDGAVAWTPRSDAA